VSKETQSADWPESSFDGSRREQLRQAQAMSLRQRLEALDQLAELSDRLQAMPKRYAATSGTSTTTTVREPDSENKMAHPGDERDGG